MAFPSTEGCINSKYYYFKYNQFTVANRVFFSPRRIYLTNFLYTNKSDYFFSPRKQNKPRKFVEQSCTSSPSHSLASLFYSLSLEFQHIPTIYHVIDLKRKYRMYVYMGRSAHKKVCIQKHVIYIHIFHLLVIIFLQNEEEYICTDSVYYFNMEIHCLQSHW